VNEGDFVLEMRGLTKVYGSGEAAVSALDAVDFQVRREEVVIVMGPSGAGKTTFLTIAGALLRPTSGQVIVDGVDITALEERELASVRQEKIGFVFQNFNLLESLTALENVALVLNARGVKGKHAFSRAVSLMHTFGLERRQTHLPRDLSGGEKQRVAIARALANNPVLILADEPTANLDWRRGREVMQLLRMVARDFGKAVIIVSHDHRTREVADRVMWLEDGRFRPAVKPARDPVCGAMVETEGSPSASHAGRTFYFCAQDCLRQFQENPARFAASAGGDD
jgi:putative ABC transport system ATP-binding protein